MNADAYDEAALSQRALRHAQHGQFAAARSLFERLTAGNPAEADHWINLGCVCLDLGDLPATLSALERARSLRPSDTNVLLNLGLAHFRSSDYPKAMLALESALFADPALALATVYLARCHVELDRPADALRVLESLRSPKGLDATALNELGLTWIALDQPRKARAAFELALHFDPQFDEAQSNLAVLAERDNRVDEAEACLARQSEFGRQQPVARLVQARVRGRRGELSSALELLAGIELGKLDRRTASEIAFEQGQLLDRLGKSDAAYQALLEANELARAHRGALRSESPTGAPLEWMRDHPELDAAVLAAQQEPPAPRTPVFLVGFPRSGTTLLDQALDAHPSCAVLEEKPAVEEIARSLRQRSHGYPGSMAKLSTADIDRLRSLYWRVVEKHLQLREDQILIDKYPFNLAHLQLILRVFPRAKFIFAIRHPCDVVLSCFMQNFRFTDSTQGFWTLQGSAEIYVRVMSLWLDQRRRLNPVCLDLRYETLVQDFEAELRETLTFLQLPWNDAVLRYAQHARGRHIRTPSYNQVVQPIYTHARGRWLKYRRHFAGVESLLAPLARQLGYQEVSAPSHTERI